MFCSKLGKFLTFRAAVKLQVNVRLLLVVVGVVVQLIDTLDGGAKVLLVHSGETLTTAKSSTYLASL